MSEPLANDELPQDVTTESGFSISFAYARRHGVIVSQLNGAKASLLCRQDISPQIISELRRSIGMPLDIELTDKEQFEKVLQETYEQGSNQEAMEMMGDMSDEPDLFQVAEELPEPEDLMESDDDAPIIRLINAVLAQAVKEGASDVHIEPFEHRLAVRFRVDGVLREILTPNRALAGLLVSRIKVMAKLDIAEKRLPQDGRISLRVAGRPVDVRVSTIPTGHGERVVMRLLDKQAGRLNLTHLGTSPETLSTLQHAIRRPHGIILVTGPTGSGKTTTLYAALTEINNSERNIMTVEDPIEYYLDGVSQTNVNSKVDMSFARGLRAILRQDPDVVMVGEIRDKETAEIAVQASLTGHLVLSTLHTNSAVGAVTRLRDMGVEPFLLSSTLLAVMSQRLVRVLCTECKEPYSASPADCALLEVEPDSAPVIYRQKGCPKCSYQGYEGRSGIYELAQIDDRVRAMIHENASEQEMEDYVRDKSPSLRQDGMRRVLNGETSLEEVLRVSREG